MNCPKCKSSNFRKDGIVNKKQRYLCKNCQFRYAVLKRSTEKYQEIRSLALEMYLEGLGFQAIGRLLKISNVTLLKWVQKWAQTIDFTSKNEVKIAEIDNRVAAPKANSYLYFIKKNIAGYGFLLINWVENLSILCADAEVLNPEGLSEAKLERNLQKK